MKPGAPKGRTMAENAVITRRVVELINAGCRPRDVAAQFDCHINSLRRRLRSAGYVLQRSYVCYRIEDEDG